MGKQVEHYIVVNELTRDHLGTATYERDHLDVTVTMKLHVLPMANSEYVLENLGFYKIGTKKEN